MSTIDLDRNVFIVSGASRGIGWEMADALAAAGASVALTAPDRDGEELKAATARIAAHAGRRAIAIVGDNSHFPDCERAVEQTLTAFGTLDGLVNNAGLGPAHVWPNSAETLRPFWEADPARWSDVIRVNVIGTFYMARAVTPHLVRKHKGRIVNTSTSLSIMLREGGTPYGPSKGAIEALTLAWAEELATVQVTVNSLLPGGSTDTAFVPQEQRRTRQLLDPAIMRAPIVWLMSPLSDGITGRRIVAKNWDTALAPAAAAQRALEPSVYAAAKV